MKGRVLLADDEAVILECLGAILASEDFEVRKADSAAAAMAALEENEFDVVITDMAMETKTAGYDVVRAAQGKSHRPVVFILTGVFIPPAEWKKRGATALFTKGEGMPGTLINAVKNFGESSQRRTALACPQKMGGSKAGGMSREAPRKIRRG